MNFEATRPQPVNKLKIPKKETVKINNVNLKDLNPNKRRIFFTSQEKEKKGKVFSDLKGVSPKILIQRNYTVKDENNLPNRSLNLEGYPKKKFYLKVRKEASPLNFVQINKQNEKERRKIVIKHEIVEEPKRISPNEQHKLNPNIILNNHKGNVKHPKIHSAQLNRLKEAPIKIIPKKMTILNKPILKENKNECIIKNYYVQLEANLSYRPTMEDHVYTEKNFYVSNKDHISFFAVYDGFGGDAVSIFLKENFHLNLKKNLIIFNFEVDKAFTQTFREMEIEIAKIPGSEDCGSTATVMLLWNNMMHVANVGNSSCFVIYNEKALALTKDHKCNDAKEVERIKKNEGLVFNGRVFGSLDLTRCLGGLQYKSYGVSAVPTISLKKIGTKDKFAIIASDGIWTFFKQEELEEMLNGGNFSSSEELCNQLVKTVLDRGGSDNISCIVIMF